MEVIVGDDEAVRCVTTSPEGAGPDAGDDADDEKENEATHAAADGGAGEGPKKMKKMTGYMHYSKEQRAEVKAAIEADAGNEALGVLEKNQKIMSILGARWKALDEAAQAEWSATAPEYEVKVNAKKVKRLKKGAITDAERSRAREILDAIVADRIAKRDRDSLESASFGAAVAVVAPAVFKKMAGKAYFDKEHRADAKAAVEKDNEGLAGKEKEKLVQKVLAEMWKALTDEAKAKWTSDAPEVEVKAKKARAADDAEETARETALQARVRKLEAENAALKSSRPPPVVLPVAPVQEVLPMAPEPMEVEPTTMKKMSGKAYFDKECRAAVKAAVDRDHADLGGKERQALVQKLLAADWKALSDEAKATWAADAPEVEAKKRSVTFWVDERGPAKDESEWVYRAHALRGSRRVKDSDACFDDYCTLCYEGGALICCVSCPRAFHVKCVKDHVGAKFVPGARRAARDLGVAASKKTQKKGDHAPAAAALVDSSVVEVDEEDEDWHCPACLSSHEETCVHCGEPGDGETRLIPCESCPRAFHAKCAKVGEAGALLVASRGNWRCVDCAPGAPSEAKKHHQAPLEEALACATLAKIETLCASLPRDHFASVFGSRLSRIRTLAAAVPARARDKAAAACDGRHDAAAVASRLHFESIVGDDDKATTARRSIAAATLASDAAERFAADGICAVPGALTGAQTAAARTLVEDYYEDVVHTVSQLNLSEDLLRGGFSTFKARDRGRFDMVVPGLAATPCLSDDAKWLPLVRSVLGDDAKLCHVGCIIALPDSAAQKWHSDGDHVHDELQLRAHALNVFVPLVDISLKNGATEFVPRTHYDWRADGRPTVVDAAAGDAVVFDWRLKHRGLSNKSSKPRPLLYLTYAQPWFVDKYNFSKSRYADLPALVPRTTRDGRAEQRG